MKKIVWVFVLALGLFVFVGSASAHVSLSPKEAVPGYNTFVVRVPNEKDIPTIGVRLLVPEGVDVTGIKPVPGWTYSVVREETMTDEEAMEEGDGHADEEATEGRITEVVWTGSVGAGEFQEFPISVRYTGEPTTVTWKAYQTYAGGEVVAWDGTDEGHPAPAVKYAAAVAPTTGAPAVVAAAAASQSPWLSVAAIVLSIAALAMSLKKK